MLLNKETIKLLSLIGFLLIFITACRKIETEASLGSIDKISNPNQIPFKLTANEENVLMEEFASLLSKVVRDDKDVRVFLKEEAQKKFNLDYDILYHLVKNKSISNSESLHDKLLKYSSDDILSRIESQLPLLTIFVPELPGGFSADTWQAESEIPSISTGIVSEDKVSYIMADGKQTWNNRELIPGFPILVVKNNERVKLAKNAQESRSLKSGGSNLVSDVFSYEFLSENFNGLSSANNSGDMTIANYSCVGCTPPSKVLTAYELWAYDYPNDNLWQRDYIYYSISPTSINGPLDTDFQEHLTTLKFHTGLEAYNKITDQDDPQALDEFRARWTEGSYEFSLVVLINSTIGIGPTITKSFPVAGPDLFHVTYTLVFHDPVFNRDFYKINTITPKRYILPTPVPIAPWDIKNYSIGWKAMLSEVDPSQTETRQETISTQIAGNFGFDGVLKKLGLKFGASGSTNNTHTYTIVSQMDDDLLGEAAMYFYDPVITFYDIIPNHGPSYTFRDYDTGWALLTIQPLEVP